MYVYVYKKAFTKSPTTVEHRIQTCSPIVILLQIQSAETAEKRIEQDPGSRGSSHEATKELQRISKAETIRS